MNWNGNGNIAETVACGKIAECADIKSSLGPFRILPDYTTTYPQVVVNALYGLYDEYNRAFASLVEANREWPTDYNLCMLDGIPVNWCVQIDMAGLGKTELAKLAAMPETEVRKILRKKIFEIENSIAVYQILERFFPQCGKDSFFKTRFRAILDSLRQRFGKPIALLAVTKEKYDAMLTIEFGINSGEEITDQEVKELSGFDAFFGPQQFLDHLDQGGGKCGYLLYVRSSDPVFKLKKPDSKTDHPLLSEIKLRKIIKANALTMNIDAPEMERGKKINDTKEYMPIMNMAFEFATFEDLYSDEFRAYLTSQGIDPVDVISGKMAIRCKPAKGAYGCYGHVFGFLTETKFRKELDKNLRMRGYYIAQPELATPVIADASSGTEYTFIDRIFLGMADGIPWFIGGVRNLVPTASTEARKHRIHGNSSAVYAEIIGSCVNP